MADTPPADLPALVDYVDATAAGLGLLAARTLGGGSEQAVRAMSIAWGLTGLLRAVPFHARVRRLHLPQTVLAEHGLAPHDVLDQRRPSALAEVVRTVAEEARCHLAAGRERHRTVPRRLLPVMFLGTLAAHYLRQLDAVGYDVYAPQLQEVPPGRVWRLLWASLIGRF